MQTMDKSGSSGGGAAGVAPVNPRRRPAPWPVAFYRSAVGKKWVMAITGIILMGYVLVHMIGNLKIYQGAHDLNLYGEFLRELLYPLVPRTLTLWAFRVVLILAFAFHIHAAAALTVMNRRANAGGYQSSREWQAANAASRSMRITGVVILLFVFWHLADFTWGWVNPDYVRGDVYRNVMASLSNAVPAAIYVIGNIALGIHLFHGSWSIFQSLGLNNPRYNSWRRTFAYGFAAIVTVGNLSFPFAVLTDAAFDEEACLEVDDRIVTCHEVFTEAIREGRFTIEEFDELTDGERHEIVQSFELQEKLLVEGVTG